MGESFSGLVHCYAAYHHYESRLLGRPAAGHSRPGTTPKFGPRQSTSSMSQKAGNHHEPWQRRVAQLSDLAICRPFVADPSAVKGKLCWRIERFIKELFVFVAEQVPADNTPAERSLRHLVIRQGQRRHPLGAGHREQDDAGLSAYHAIGHDSRYRVSTCTNFDRVNREMFMVSDRDV